MVVPVTLSLQSTQTNSDSKRKSQKNNDFIDPILNKAEQISEWPLEKLAKLGQNLEKSKNPAAKWLANFSKSLGIMPDSGLAGLYSSFELQQKYYPTVYVLADLEAKRQNYQSAEDWSAKKPEDFQSFFNEALELVVHNRAGQQASEHLNTINLNEHASEIVNEALEQLQLRREIKTDKAETQKADNNIQLFFRRGKVAQKIDELVEKSPNLSNNPEIQRNIKNLAKAQLNQRFEGIAQIFNFGIFPTMIGPLFLNGARMASEMGNSFLSQIAMALALGAFSTQPIAIGKSVSNLNYSGLGARVQKLISPLLLLTFFSHILASFTRIAGVFSDVNPEEEAKPNSFTPIKKFLSNFFFKPIELLARIVNSSSFALFTLKDFSELNVLKNSGMNPNSLEYKTELNVIRAKTAFNAIATVGTTISNIGSLIAEHKQEAIYKNLNPLIELLNGKDISIFEITNNQKLSPEAKALAIKFIKEKNIVMPQIEAYGAKLVVQVRAGKLSPEKAQVLLEQKQQALGAKLEDLLQQIVALIQDKTKGISQQAWLFESIGTLSFLGMLPSLLCRRSIAGLTQAAQLIDRDPAKFANHKNGLIKFCRAYGQVINSGGLRTAEEGQNNVSKLEGRMAKVRTWSEIPFALLMMGVSISKFFTDENSPAYNKDAANLFSKNQGLLKFIDAVGNFAMIV